MKYDKPLIAFLLGAVATLPYEVLTRLLVSLGIGKYSVYQLNSLIVTLNRPDGFLGFFTASVSSGVLAVTLYYVLGKLGWDYLIIKAAIFNMLSWLVLEAVYVWLIEGPGLIEPRPVPDYYVEMSGALIFGLTLGVLFRHFLLNDYLLDK